MNLDESLYRLRRRASLAVMWIKQWTGYGLPFNKRVKPENYTFCRSKSSCLPSFSWFYESLALSDFITQNDQQAHIIPNPANRTVSIDDLCWHKAPET